MLCWPGWTWSDQTAANMKGGLHEACIEDACPPVVGAKVAIDRVGLTQGYLVMQDQAWQSLPVHADDVLQAQQTLPFGLWQCCAVTPGFQAKAASIEH